jgi:pimeloyl-ACP methyl ester carboxylesterase
MRAREPDDTGFVERDGVKVPYEVFGSAGPTVVLLTSWAIVHARQWKAQVPYLARHFRVVTVEGRGNGTADRPTDPAAYADREYVGDAVAVLDALGVDRAVVVGLSLGGRHALQMAAWHPERVSGVVAIGATLPWTSPPAFDEPKPEYEGWGKVNRNYWLADYRGWVEFFVSQIFTEPHSTKHIEDGVGWGLETDAETLLLTVPAKDGVSAREAEETCRAIRCPVLLLHGDEDAIVPYTTGVTLAEWTGGDLVTMRNVGHAPPMREPVATNLLIREFVERVAGPPRAVRREWTRALNRRRRALFVCSPIGLGHARRDIAIAAELRALHPELEIDWLTQEPVARALRDRGERVHPASASLASESAHIESEAGEHDLHVFQAIRRMDEILVANFMVFADLVREESYDLWVADEGWDIDHFLHENPELKRSPFAWLTDFVGWLPVAGEQAITADYNAEMVEHIARYPRLRDRSVFVGEPGDLVSDPLGPGLPTVADWTREHFAFAGYVTGDEPLSDRAELRAALQWQPDERVCVVTVGGSGVGAHLLHRVVAAYPEAARLVPGLRMIVVTGPRIDPASVPAAPGVQVRGYVRDLHRELTACDLAVVQGGLTTTMELVAARRPFLYIPLSGHFEQQRHVPHRLARHRAGRRMDYEELTPDRLATAIAEEIDREVDYLAVPTDGARRAAGLLAELL